MGSSFYIHRSCIISNNSGLKNSAEGYLTLASQVSELAPYELPPVIAQIPPPPIDVPIPVRRALTIDGEEKVIIHLLCGEYEMTNTSWFKLQKIQPYKNMIYSALKGKRRPGGLQYQQKRTQTVKPKPTMSHTNSKTK